MGSTYNQFFGVQIQDCTGRWVPRISPATKTQLTPHFDVALAEFASCKEFHLELTVRFVRYTATVDLQADAEKQEII